MDDEVEINDAVANMLTELDDNQDQRINIEDLTKRWASVAHLLSCAEVLEWLQHSQQLPADVIASFERHKITGDDFPVLLERNGALLETQLNVTQATSKMRIVRGMRMKLMAMGKVPEKLYASAKSKSCSSVVVSWKTSSAEAFPAHKYLVQKREHPSPSAFLWFRANATTESRWRTVYDGLESHFEDSHLSPHVSYKYRLSAWNLLGRSEYEYVEETTVASPCDKQTMTSWLSFVVIMLTRVFEVLSGLAPLLFAYYHWRRESASKMHIFRLLFSVLRFVGFIQDEADVSPPPDSLSPRSPQSARPLLTDRQPSARTLNSSTDSYSDRAPSIQTVGRGTSFNRESNKKDCVVCQETFTWYEKRFKRHRCKSCNKCFHKDCGHTDHDFLDCPVDGKCICNTCESRRASVR